MKCNQCTKLPQTAGDVRACEVCVADRTANEVPYHMPDDTPLEQAVAAKSGLANRFTSEPSERDSTQEPPAPRAPIADETPATDPTQPLKAPRRKK